MTHRPEQQHLLNDVIAESSLADFRAALLAETLRLARRRRHWRYARQGGGLLSVLFLGAWLAWHGSSIKTSPAGTPQAIPLATSYHLIETQPWPVNVTVTTTEFAGVKVISSEPTIPMVATASGGFRFINDAQLLTLLEPRAALLVRTGPNSEEIVFADLKPPQGTGVH